MHNTPHTDEAKAKMSAARRGKPANWKHRPTEMRDGVTHYRCGRCLDFLPKDGFYTNKRTLLGIKSECKACHSATAIKSRDAENTRRLRRESSARIRAAHLEAVRQRERLAAASRPKNERTQARALLNSAVQAGKVVRATACECCGAVGLLHGHHTDYSKPLSVTWLCPLCHGKEHRKAAP